jgi:L-2-hydroxyglutarate oxidase
MKQRIVVVGGGIIGLAAAWRLQQTLPDSHVIVLEKEAEVGRHQSSHNSGVLHAGLYYKTGSRKARLAVAGIRQMVEFCEQRSIAHEVCGKIVVAVTHDELPRLKSLFDRGLRNGLQGLRWLGAEQLREMEPHAAGVAAVHVPQEGIADYPAVCRALSREVIQKGGEVLVRARVMAIVREGNEWRVESTAGTHTATRIVTCAGLHSDRVAALTGQPRKVRILPFRGEYFKLSAEREDLVRHLIYPVPDARFPFLGVHFTRMIRGGVEAGPNAVLALSREGYRKTDIRVGDLADALSFAGLWKFLHKYSRVSWDEVRRSLSKELFCAALQRLVPEIQVADLEQGGAGVRAQAMTAEGALVEDFTFVEGPRELHLVNAPSPGATASLAIGAEIATLVESRI